jgi:RHH-type transcriptional regulator, proline utilization regulon repressor / proline dehydrogenase / delta 1-pyrroline-5-carboxylate dehydrogenase
VSEGFANEPVLELRRAPVRTGLLEALRGLDRRLPLRVPVWVGEERGAEEGIDSTDPGAPERLVAVAGAAGGYDVDRAVGEAARGFREWSGRGAEARAGALRRAATALRRRRPELAALQVR